METSSINSNYQDPSELDGVKVSFNGAVRFHRPPFLDTLDVTECARSMEALHRNRLLAIQAEYRKSGSDNWRIRDEMRGLSLPNSFITKTTFDSLRSIFIRYRDTLSELHGEDIEWLKKFTAEFTKADALEVVAKERLSQASKLRGDDGNFTIKERIRQQA